MFIRTHNAELFTLAFGDASDTLLMCGGWAGSWEVWAETIPYLLSGWRCVAYDHRGAGATLCPAESITFEALVDDVFVVMDGLKLERCVMAAESAGAAVALAAALRHPDRISGLVLVDGLVTHAVYDETAPFALGIVHQFEATVGRFVDACVVEADSDAIRNWGRQILMRSPQAAALRLYLAMSGIDMLREANQVTQPTLIVHGSQDQIVPLESARTLAARIPNAHLHIIDGTGHVPTITRPQEVAEAIRQFWSGWNIWTS